MAHTTTRFILFAAALSFGAGCSGKVDPSADETPDGGVGLDPASNSSAAEKPDGSNSPRDGSPSGSNPQGGPATGADDDDEADESSPSSPSRPSPAPTPDDPDIQDGSGGSGPSSSGPSASPSPSSSPTETDPENPEDNPGPGGTPSIPDDPVACVDGALQLGTAPARRLSAREYLLTLSDLFPSANLELPVLPTEAPVDSFDNDAPSLGPSDIHVSRWEEIAFRYTSEATANDAQFAALVPCSEAVSGNNSARQCGAEFIESFGLKTHRRPLTEAERERYQGLFNAQLSAIDFRAAVQLTAMAMLQSPWFLYRLETSTGGDTGAAVPLNSWEVASRLSYFLWQSMPDQELFDAAREDQLTEASGIEAQVRRMLADPKAEGAVVDFHRQWLVFDRILTEEHQERTPELFPNWSSQVPQAAHEEMQRFVRRVLFDGQGTLADLLLSREAEVDARLAAIYGVTGPSEPGEWASVTLPEDERAGFLTRIGFLAAHAHDGNGSPPLRGVYVMRQLFCMPPVAPPADADTSTPSQTGEDGALTNREAFELRVEPATCQGCHVVIDGFGFAFENYDAIGAYREIDNGKPVDAVTTLLGTDVTGTVDGAIAMSERFAESEQLAACAVSRWFRYAQGRSIESADQCVMNRLQQSFAESGGNVLDLMLSITLSPEFRHRISE